MNMRNINVITALSVPVKPCQMILCMLFSVTAPQESYFLHRRNSVLSHCRTILI
ncbi:Protein of uncharacterised function (DUF2689) [Klebsiella pneumoniae]|nr:Protein of uncharacterised function (DUF2689) [Klebsiella pneumoniae]